MAETSLKNIQELHEYGFKWISVKGFSPISVMINVWISSLFAESKCS